MSENEAVVRREFEEAKTRRSAGDGHRGEPPDMRPRRFVGVLERALLGAAMSASLLIVERRLMQSTYRAT